MRSLLWCYFNSASGRLPAPCLPSFVRTDGETDHPMAIMIIMIVRNCLLASFSSAAAAVAPNEDWPWLPTSLVPVEYKLYQRFLI